MDGCLPLPEGVSLGDGFRGHSVLKSRTAAWLGPMVTGLLQAAACHFRDFRLPSDRSSDLRLPPGPSLPCSPRAQGMEGRDESSCPCCLIEFCCYSPPRRRHCSAPTTQLHGRCAPPIPAQSLHPQFLPNPCVQNFNTGHDKTCELLHARCAAPAPSASCLAASCPRTHCPGGKGQLTVAAHATILQGCLRPGTTSSTTGAGTSGAGTSGAGTSGAGMTGTTGTRGAGSQCLSTAA